MILSIVSGTWNRLYHLQMMIASVRQQIPRGIAYEFVIIDAGSTDGTLEWCRQQADVMLMEDGQRTGAISAFCRGAEASHGEYVLLANDDVVFHASAIPAALAHLETHAECAAVAFADNRTSILTGSGADYRTEGIGCTLPNGAQSMVTYAQVGLFRRQQAQEAGWWGWQDPIMQQSRTYGGDSYLSARLWEAGYTVDSVPSAAVDDLIVRDELRNENAAAGGNDSKAYYTRFPTVNIPAQRSAVVLNDRLRVLFLPVYEAGYMQAANHERKWTEAFQDIGTLVIEVDYLNTKTNLPALAKAWQPDLVLAQIQGAGPKLTPQILADMRQSAPNAVFVSWNGDAHMQGLVSQPMLDLYEHLDLVTTVNAAALPVLATFGIHAAYWQIGYTPPVGELPDAPHYDVLAQMNWYDYREPLFQILYGLPYHVGVYGNDARAQGNTHYSFAAQAALYANATITVGDTFPFHTKSFMSNRVLQCLGAGGFLLLQRSEALEEYTGLRAGIHYVEWTDLDDLRAKIAYWLDDEWAHERAEIAAAGQSFVKAHFSYDAQVKKLLTELIPGVSVYAPMLAEVWHDGIPR